MAVATRLVEKERRGNAIGIILMGLSSSLVLGVPAGTFSVNTLGGGLCSSSSGAEPCSAVHHLCQGPCHQRKRSRHPQDAAVCAEGFQNCYCSGDHLTICRGYATLFTYITPYLQAASSLSVTEISGVLFLAGVCSFMGSKLGGQLADSKGSKFTIITGLLLQAATLLLFAMAGVHVIVLLLILMIFMLGTWSISPRNSSCWSPWFPGTRIWP